MAQVDPRLLLQAAMASGGGQTTGAPTDVMGGGVPGTTPDTLPGAAPGAQPAGAVPPSGSQDLSNVDLANTVGQGAEMGQQPDAVQQMVAMLNDPSTPPDQRAQIQMRLQLAALQSIAGGPQGATGSSS